MAKIDDTDTDVLRTTIAHALVRMASQGSVPAGNAALALINELEERALADEHAEILSRGGADMAYHLGRIGADIEELDQRLDGEADETLLSEFERGIRDRELEVRAIELARVRRGGTVREWMAPED